MSIMRDMTENFKGLRLHYRFKHGICLLEFVGRTENVKIEEVPDYLKRIFEEFDKINYEGESEIIKTLISDLKDSLSRAVKVSLEISKQVK